MYYFFFFFNDTATTEIYTLSLHDALPIYHTRNATIYDRPDQPIPIYIGAGGPVAAKFAGREGDGFICTSGDRKSTRLNSSHGYISYAVFCLKKKKKRTIHANRQWASYN